MCTLANVTIHNVEKMKINCLKLFKYNRDIRNVRRTNFALRMAF